MKQPYTAEYALGWPGHEAQLEQWGDAPVSVVTLLNPPDKRSPEIFTRQIAKAAPAVRPEGVDWEPKDLTGNQVIAYVPMNSSGYAHFGANDPASYVATGNLNNCTAVAAAYSEGRGLTAFLAHYDAEAIREVDDEGRQRIGMLLGRFAGRRAVDVVIAYPESVGMPRLKGEGYDSPHHSTEALVESTRALPAGSNVVLLPYKSSQEGIDNPLLWQMLGRTHGYTLHVGQGTASTQFGWNGERIKFGSAQEPNILKARQHNAALIGQLEADIQTA